MISLLCVGDMHLGKRASGLPDDLNATQPDLLGRVQAPMQAWYRTVDYAIEHRADAVLLAGDVVEQEDDFFEAYSALHRGVERLHQAGITVLGVAGNHDVIVLPKLAKAIPPFHLLGANGQWERHRLTVPCGESVDICGWSFPAREYRNSPLSLNFPSHMPDHSPCPTVGLLHCDRDQGNSRYAPVRSSELIDAPVDAWFLGHIHKPDSLDGPRPCGYLGSLMGLDISETGPHGPWWVQIEQGQITATQKPLAPLRWERVPIALDTAVSSEDLPERMINALRTVHSSLSKQTIRPEVVGCLITLTGKHHDGAALQRWLATNDPRTLYDNHDGIHYFVARVDIHSLPDVDIHTLAQGFDPVALLAQKILLLHQT